MDETLPFLSQGYLLYLALLLFTRGLDFLSTWIATPHMVLEGNPIARKLGWKWGAVVNLALCFTFALFPLPALIIATTSVLVAAHNFDAAWLMHTMGEDSYRAWISRQHLSVRPSLYVFCLLSKTALWGAVGLGLVLFADGRLVSTGIGFGMVGYAVAVLVYSAISAWRLRRVQRIRAA
ncbi:MAG: hypothetical protein MUE94_03500 [Verrucomicrobia bacterium]|jgi:hypothetical protein|nr:hypothetical protein [Verrucomicrobiota bacterium]